MDLTKDCLKRQNNSFAYLTKELTAMFIRHCPDLELQPLQQWTAADVHEKLLEHSKDQKYGSQLSASSALSSQQQEDEGGVSSHSGSLMVDGDGEAVCDVSVASAGYKTRAWVSDLPSEVSDELLMTEDAQLEGAVMERCHPLLNVTQNVFLWFRLMALLKPSLPLETKLLLMGWDGLMLGQGWEGYLNLFLD
ncbi:hypothetical protein AMECASPLE_008575 [Ameca splendens]|uniref:Uncharacterized protein n=1 Tax=Ameca splendens TaxID=208324 RepID=A0ABV0Z954_9TELE